MMTLHAAIALVLEENDNRWMHVRDVADQINGQQLYVKQNHSQLDFDQIRRRVEHHLDIFEKQGAMVIRLRTELE
jgi:hypothetical protein